MRQPGLTVASAALVAACAAFGKPVFAQAGATRDSAPDPIKGMVARLDLEKYKATIKGLTQFGDRRQGTDRNRAAVDWIEAQLKSYGCTNTERIKYEYNGRQLKNDSTNKVDSLHELANPGSGRTRRGAARLVAAEAAVIRRRCGGARALRARCAAAGAAAIRSKDSPRAPA